MRSGTLGWCQGKAINLRSSGSILDGTTLRIRVSLHGHRSNATVGGFGYWHRNARHRVASHEFLRTVGYVRLFICCKFCNDSHHFRNHKTAYVENAGFVESERNSSSVRYFRGAEQCSRSLLPRNTATGTHSRPSPGCLVEGFATAVKDRAFSNSPSVTVARPSYSDTGAVQAVTWR